MFYYVTTTLRVSIFYYFIIFDQKKVGITSQRWFGRFTNNTFSSQIVKYPLKRFVSV